MGTIPQPDGYQPICNDCGITLCFVITEPEYKRTKEFWEQWRCVYCDPHAIGSFARWLQSNKKEKIMKIQLTKDEFDFMWRTMEFTGDSYQDFTFILPTLADAYRNTNLEWTLPNDYIELIKEKTSEYCPSVYQKIVDAG